MNVRDLGGLPLVDGGTTAFGVVVRADSIRALSDAGWRSLADYGVRRAVDLRGDHELEADPPGDVPIEIIRIPMDPHEAPPAVAFPSIPVVYAALLDRFQEGFARVVSEVGEADAPIVVHCAGGRDRTGLVAALLESLVGVAPGAIADDHGLSDQAYAPTREAWIAEGATPEQQARRRRTSAPAGRAMLDVLAALDDRHGGVRPYLRAGGADEATLARVARRLAGEP